MAMEPGLDAHEWIPRYESIAEDMRDDPRGALPDLRRLVEEMLDQRGYDLDDPIALEGDAPEVIATFRAARETALLADENDVDPGDVGEAIEGFTAVYEYLLAERTPP